MFLYLVPEDEEDAMQEFVCMKTAQDTNVPWLCSQTDLLAEDWVVI